MDLLNSAKSLLDPYDLRARLVPALLLVAPVLVVAASLYDANITKSSTILSILVGSGMLYAFARVARDRGKRLQEKLYKQWGGTPSVQILRHADRTLDAHTKSRYHALLAKQLERPFPMPEEESRDPAAADELYRAATRWLIDSTRDTQRFPLIFKENIAYGFHRNALGLKPIALGLLFACIVWILAHAGVVVVRPPYVEVSKLWALSPNQLVALITALACVVVWLLVATKEATRRAAFAYAERLVESCSSATTPTAKRTKEVR